MHKLSQHCKVQFAGKALKRADEAEAELEEKMKEI